MNKGIESLVQKVSNFSTVGLDSCVFIYLFENNAPYNSACSAIFEMIENGKIDAVISTITLSEVLTQPMKKNQVGTVFELDQTIRNIPNLTIVPIQEGEARLAGYFKAKHNFKLPDCLHVASVLSAGAQLFITNDEQIKKVKTPEVICLSDFV